MGPKKKPSTSSNSSSKSPRRKKESLQNKNKGPNKSQAKKATSTKKPVVSRPPTPLSPLPLSPTKSFGSGRGGKKPEKKEKMVKASSKNKIKPSKSVAPKKNGSKAKIDMRSKSPPKRGSPVKVPPPSPKMKKVTTKPKKHQDEEREIEISKKPVSKAKIKGNNDSSGSRKSPKSPKKRKPPTENEDGLSSPSVSPPKKKSLIPKKSRIKGKKFTDLDIVRKLKDSPTKRVRTPRFSTHPPKRIKRDRGIGPRRRYLRQTRYPVDEFNKGNRATEFGLKYQNYFSYLYLVSMQDFGTLLDEFQLASGWSFARFAEIASRNRITQILRTTTIMDNIEMKEPFMRLATSVLFDASTDLWLSDFDPAMMLSANFEHSRLKRRLGAFFLLYLLHSSQTCAPKERIILTRSDLVTIHEFTSVLARQEICGPNDIAKEYRFLLFHMKYQDIFTFSHTRHKHEMTAEMISLNCDIENFKSIGAIGKKEVAMDCLTHLNGIFTPSIAHTLDSIHFTMVRRKKHAQEIIDKRIAQSPPKKRSPYKGHEPIIHGLIDLESELTFQVTSKSKEELSIAEEPLPDRLERTYKKLDRILSGEYFNLDYTLSNPLANRLYNDELDSLQHKRNKSTQYRVAREAKRIEETGGVVYKKNAICDPASDRMWSFIKNMPKFSSRTARNLPRNFSGPGSSFN